MVLRFSLLVILFSHAPSLFAEEGAAPPTEAPAAAMAGEGAPYATEKKEDSFQKAEADFRTDVKTLEEKGFVKAGDEMRGLVQGPLTYDELVQSMQTKYKLDPVNAQVHASHAIAWRQALRRREVIKDRRRRTFEKSKHETGVQQ